MTPREMDRLLDEHFQMEQRTDFDALLAACTDDIEHDDVGNPAGPIRGKAAVRALYEGLTREMQGTGITPLYRYYGDNFVVDDMIWEARAVGRPFGIEGHGRPVRLRMLHIFEFRDGLIARENVWVDWVAFFAQLGALPTAA